MFRSAGVTAVFGAVVFAAGALRTRWDEET
jgi:hypothetical protein